VSRVPDELCTTERPELLVSEPDHFVRCHIPGEERRKIATEVLAELNSAQAAKGVAT
jgi:hypothetical protein